MTVVGFARSRECQTREVYRMIFNSHGHSYFKRFAAGAAATSAFVLAFVPASVANLPTADCESSVAITADAAASKAIIVAEQNVLVVPGQEAMQPQQAEIIQRNEQQEQVDAAKHRPNPIVERGTQAYGDEEESRQEQLERPSERQLEIERGSSRQKDLEMPDGPGVKY